MTSEERGEAAPATEAEAVASEKRRIRLDRILAGLETQLEIADIRIGDPRFRWIGAQMAPKPAQTARLLDILRDLGNHDRTTPGDGVEWLEHIRDYVADLEAQDLEDELSGILGPLVGRPDHQAARLPAMMRRFGWDGRPPGTLEEVGELLGVTRERVRQIELAVDAALHEHPCWTPVLDRAIRILAREAPVPFDRVGTILTSARLTTNTSFSAESLLSAHRLLNQSLRLSEESLHDIQFLVRAGESLALPWFSDARGTIQRRISNQGIAEVAAIVADAASDGSPLTCEQVEQTVHWTSRWQLIDGHWIVPTDLDVRNPLLNRIRKVLFVAPGISLTALHLQLLREDRPDRLLDLSLQGLEAFVRWHPAVTIDASSRIVPQSSVGDDVLSDSERVILEALSHQQEAASFQAVVDECDAAGLSRVTAALTLRISPIVVKVARNAYCRVSASTQPDHGTHDDPVAIQEPESFPEESVDTQEPGEDRDSLEPAGTQDIASEAEDTSTPPSPTIESRDASESDIPDTPGDILHGDGPTSEATADDTIDEAIVQQIIRIAIEQIKARGCTTRSDIAHTARRKDPDITPASIKDVLDQTTGMLWLDGDWITCLEDTCDNPLRNRIDELTRKDRRITPHTVRLPGRAGAGIPDRVYKRLIDRCAAWQSTPEGNLAQQEPSANSIAMPEAAEAAPGDAQLSTTPFDTDGVAVAPFPLPHSSIANSLRLFDPVETQPLLPLSQPLAEISEINSRLPRHGEPQPADRPSRARDDRPLLDSLSEPEIAAYYDDAAQRLGSDRDDVYAAFDLIPPDIVHWLRGNAERSRRVRALMASDAASPDGSS